MVFSASSAQISLEVPAILVAECRRRDGSSNHAKLDLNQHIGNREGKFDPNGHRFVSSARGIRLHGTTLQADLKTSKGVWCSDAIDLDSFIINEDGCLIVIRDAAPKQLTVSNVAQQPKRKILCEVCRDWSVPSFREDSSRFSSVIEIKYSELSSSKRRRNCASCALAERIIQELAPRLFKHPEIRPEDFSLHFTSRASKYHVQGCPTFVIKAKSHNGAEQSMKCIMYSMPGKSLAGVQPGSYVANDNTSDTFGHIPSTFHARGESEPQESALIARAWIGDCIEKHDKCPGPAEHRLPTRVLDIGQFSDEPVRVITTSNTEPLQYACLSHCWGKSNTLLLTQANRDDLHVNVPFHSLQETYIDAIELTRNLGIRYLWIDTLCIIQDSVEDWKKESSMMSAYYGNCFVCIAATSAADHDGGCRTRYITLQHGGQGDDGLPYSVYVRPLIPHIPYSSMWPHERFFPLLTRAWVYQERRLSPRILHVTDAELFFECSTTTHCECGDKDARFYTTTAWTKAEETYFASHHRVNEMEDGQLKGEHEWRSHIHAYSTLNLTRQTDRLPALSGLAQWMYLRRQHLGNDPGRYLAGCWENSLIDDLAWVVDHELNRYAVNKDGSFRGIPGVMPAGEGTGLTRARPTERVAPSWSWASVLDQVNFAPYKYTEALCHIEDANIELQSPDGDPYSQVNSGWLILRAKLRPTCWTTHQQIFRGSCTYLTEIKGKSTLVSLWSDKGLRWWRDWRDRDGDQLDTKERLYLMPLASRKIWSNEKEAEFSLKWMPGMLTVKETAYLVLRLVEHEGGPQNVRVYERLGWASYSGMTAGPDFSGIEMGLLKLI